MQVIDIHTHLITVLNVCKHYLGINFLQSLINKHSLPFVLALDNLIPFTKKDTLSRYADMIRSENKTAKQLLNKLIAESQGVDEFCILTINMQNMGGGKVPQSFEDQLKDVIKLKLDGYPIRIFYHADPNDHQCISLLKKYEKFIDGIKLYCLMGYFPYDKRLDDVYALCVKNNWSVISHCAPENPTHYRGRDIDKRLKESRFGLIEGKNNRQKAANFAHPIHLKETARLNTNINFCAAHCGGYDEIMKFLDDKQSWTRLILDSCNMLDNFYTDISCTIASQKAYDFFRKVLFMTNISNKILYGSDYWLNLGTNVHSAYVNDLKKEIGLQDFVKIASQNTSNFMKL